MKQTRLSNHIIVGAAAVLIANLLYCSTSPVAGSAGTSNSFTATVTDSSVSGTAPVNASVGIYKADYSPIENSGYYNQTVIGSSGSYNFTSLDTGYYNIFFTLDTLAACAESIHVAINATTGSFKGQLKRTAILAGTIIPDSTAQALILTGIEIQGSPYLDSNAVDNSQNRFIFTGIAYSSYRVTAWYKNPVTDFPSTSNSKNSITIPAGSSVTADSVVMQ